MQVESRPLSDLKPHPRNYRSHPPDQIAHIVESIKANDMYRAIVTAKDMTILAGHGIHQAAQIAGLTEVPVVVLPLDPESPQALKVLAGDNEIGRMAESNDRLLSEILRDIKQADGELLGSGYDDMMLASLVFVTRPASEIQDFDEAAEWVGMGEYDEGGRPIVIQIAFPSEAQRDEFAALGYVSFSRRAKGAPLWSANWPPVAMVDWTAAKITESDDA